MIIGDGRHPPPPHIVLVLELRPQGWGSEMDRALPRSPSLWEVALGSDGYPVQWAENPPPTRRLPHSAALCRFVLLFHSKLIRLPLKLLNRRREAENKAECERETSVSITGRTRVYPIWSDISFCFINYSSNVAVICSIFWGWTYKCYSFVFNCVMHLSGFCKRIKNVPVWYKNQSPFFFPSPVAHFNLHFVLLRGSYSSCCRHNSQLTAFENRKPFLTLCTDVFFSFFYLLYPFSWDVYELVNKRNQSKWWFWARRLGNASEGKHCKGGG